MNKGIDDSQLYVFGEFSNGIHYQKGKEFVSFPLKPCKILAIDVIAVHQIPQLIHSIYDPLNFLLFLKFLLIFIMHRSIDLLSFLIKV